MALDTFAQDLSHRLFLIQEGAHRINQSLRGGVAKINNFKFRLELGNLVTSLLKFNFSLLTVRDDRLNRGSDRCLVGQECFK